MKTLSRSIRYIALALAIVSVSHAEIFRRNLTQVPVPTRPNGTHVTSGALLGAVAGAVIAHQSNRSTKALVLGAGAGAIVGGVIGHKIPAKTSRPYPGGGLDATNQVNWVNEYPTDGSVAYKYPGENICDNCARRLYGR